MCLAVPGRIVEVRDERGTRMATVDFDGIRKDICLAYLPDLAVGEYAIVHVGFAIARVDEAAALESLAVFRALGILDDEPVATGDPAGDTPTHRGDGAAEGRRPS